LAVQRFFRPLRPHPLKKDVRIVNYLPDFTPGMTEEEKRESSFQSLQCFPGLHGDPGRTQAMLVRLKTNGPAEPRGRLSLQEVFGNDYQLVMWLTF